MLAQGQAVGRRNWSLSELPINLIDAGRLVKISEAWSTGSMRDAVSCLHQLHSSKARNIPWIL